MLIAILIFLIIVVIMIGFVGYKQMYPTKPEYIKILEKQNDSLLVNNKEMFEKIKLIDNTVYKTRTAVIELKDRDKVLKKDYSKITGRYKDTNEVELKKKLDEEFSRDSIANLPTTH